MQGENLKLDGRLFMKFCLNIISPKVCTPYFPSYVISNTNMSYKKGVKWE